MGQVLGAYQLFIGIKVMIDDYVETIALMKKMKEHLPIPAHPTKEFIKCMKQKKIALIHEQQILIEDVLYLGDEGGISCAVAMPFKTETAVITSITHLCIKAGHPLAEKIENYQRNRIVELAKREMEGNTEYSEKIGRNAPCPCKSGKKYKKCCGKGNRQ